MPKPASARNQLDLFQSAPGMAESSVVGPATASASFAAIAPQLPHHLYLGTSSWTFPGWQDIVYDRSASKTHLARHGLAAYAQHPLLRTVGVDRTYYAPITATDFAAYAEAVPASFRFLVKAHVACTQAYATSRNRFDVQPGEPNPAFLNADYATEYVIEPCLEGLGDKAGPIVFQFPPQRVHALGEPQRFAERLHAFLNALPHGPLYAVELRNHEWLTATYAAALAEVGACHCYNVHPRMPDLAMQQQTVPPLSAPAVVVRWLLRSGLGYDEAAGRYQPFDRLLDPDPTNRTAIAEMCQVAGTAGRPAFVIANNKAEGSAPLTVFRLA